ncbi:MAG TPA: hypothetical protein VF729_01875 [Solirubrobacterales bacterium]
MLATTSTGFFVPIFEAAATAIAAGVVLGGFAGATAGVAYGWSRKQVESHALRDGYIGAAFVLGFWVLELCIVYATSA